MSSRKIEKKNFIPLVVQKLY